LILLDFIVLRREIWTGDEKSTSCVGFRGLNPTYHLFNWIYICQSWGSRRAGQVWAALPNHRG